MSKKKVIYQIRQTCSQNNKKPYQLSLLDIQDISFTTFTNEIKSQMQKFEQLTKLILLNCGIQSLFNMPNLFYLKIIDLTANKIKDNDIRYLTKYKNLISIDLTENLIETYIGIKELENLQKIQYLYLLNNPVSLLYHFQDNIFKIIEKLKYLDGYDQDGNFMIKDVDQSEDGSVIQEQQAEDSDDGLPSLKVQKMKRKYKKKKQVQNVECQDLDTESYESLPPNFVKTKK